MPASDAAQKEAIAQLGIVLHDLCQPLTALQCRLEIGQMQEQTLPPGPASGAWAECMRECARMNAMVIAMREQVQVIEQGRMRGME